MNSGCEVEEFILCCCILTLLRNFALMMEQCRGIISLLYFLRILKLPPGFVHYIGVAVRPSRPTMRYLAPYVRFFEKFLTVAEQNSGFYVVRIVLPFSMTTQIVIEEGR